jgi:hypothetical protein
MKTRILTVLTMAGLLFSLPVGFESFLSNLAYAQNVKEITYIKKTGTRIVVRTMAPAKVVKVEPYIKAKKGQQKGQLYLDVVIKNTAREPQSYSVFGQGRTATGGWLGGMSAAPAKGKVDPGKEVAAQVKTRYKGKAVPEEIRLDIFSPQ